MSGAWKPIETFEGADREEVDLWMHIYASPRSMGWSDSFRVTDAYRIDGKWFHCRGRFGGDEKQLEASYITHWMPLPNPPSLLESDPRKGEAISRHSAAQEPGQENPAHQSPSVSA